MVGATARHAFMHPFPASRRDPRSGLGASTQIERPTYGLVVPGDRGKMLQLRRRLRLLQLCFGLGFFLRPSPIGKTLRRGSCSVKARAGRRPLGSQRQQMHGNASIFGKPLQRLLHDSHPCHFVRDFTRHFLGHQSEKLSIGPDDLGEAHPGITRGKK